MISRAARQQTKIENRPEAEIILACARSQFDPAAEGDVRRLVRGGLDWPEVVAMSIHHRLTPLLYESVMALGPELALPAAKQRMLVEATRGSTFNTLAMLSELLRLNQLFQAAHIPVIPYKGPILAWLGYGSFIRRDFADLDFAVQQQFIPDAVAVMKSAGYRAMFEPGEAHGGQSGPTPGLYVFILSAQGILVELHTERTLRYFPVPLDFQDLNRRLISVEIAGQSLRTFSTEDTIVILCVQGARHFWERIQWILDVAKLATVQEVDWAMLLAIAEKMRSTRVLLLGLYLANDLLGAPLPESVLLKIRKDGTVRKLAEKVYEQYARISDPSAGVWPRAEFRMLSGDSMGQGFFQMMRLALKPTESDRRKVRLPGFLAPLYGVVRPWRLAREYGLGWKRRLKPDLAVYVATPMEIVDHMLRFAEVSPGDVLFDLGCGDGRIVVAAAEKYGIRAVGVDINPKRIREARARARKHGVAHLVEFHQGDARKFDVSSATIITLWLGLDGNLRLAERLRSELCSGARIVSRDFRISGWAFDRSETHELPNGVRTPIFLWTIRKDGCETQSLESSAPELRKSHKSGG